eukprot:680408-Rhodomonas_salina.2
MASSATRFVDSCTRSRTSNDGRRNEPWSTVAPELAARQSRRALLEDVAAGERRGDEDHEGDGGDRDAADEVLDVAVRTALLRVRALAAQVALPRRAG